MPDPSGIHHEAIVARRLAMLGADEPPLLGLDVLADGASGAITYRLRRAEGDAVLKVTLPDSPPHLLARARREVLFYRHLAPSLPLAVPRVMSSRLGDGHGVVLLLEAYDRFPEPWPDARFLRVADHLARFHAAYWRNDQDLASSSWLRRHAITHDDIRRAHRRWERLRADDRFRPIFTPKRHARISMLLRDIGGDDPTVAAFPRTLCHGDFHLDNFLADRDGDVVVADWQEVGSGRGPDDLTFFLQRATFSGHAPPREAMIEAYHRKLSAEVGETITPGSIRHVMDAAELRTRLLHWPDHVQDDEQMVGLLDRIDALAAGLHDDPNG